MVVWTVCLKRVKCLEAREVFVDGRESDIYISEWVEGGEEEVVFNAFDSSVLSINSKLNLSTTKVVSVSIKLNMISLLVLVISSNCYVM